MRNAKGFTVLEYVVALTLLSLIMIMVVTMFRSQTEYGRDTGKEIAVDEAVSMAFMLIRQDIMHAGLGVVDKPKLAVFLQDDPGDGSGYRELYLNYGRYLKISYDPDKNDNVFNRKAYEIASGSQISSNLFMPEADQADKDRQKQFMQPADVGAMISYDVGTDTVSTHEVTNFTDNDGPPQNTEPPFTFTVSPSLPGSRYVAPAIVYKVQSNALIRNFEFDVTSGIRTGGQIILGGEPNFRVTSFRLKANFKGNVWAPDNGTFASMQPTDLRYLEVTIKYQIRTETISAGNTGWSQTYSKSIMVAPRTVLLTQY